MSPRIRSLLTATAVAAAIGAGAVYSTVPAVTAEMTVEETLTIKKLTDEAMELEDKDKKIDAAKKVGALIAKICKSKKIDRVVFDRNGYMYHGRVSALAEAAREAGLEF